MATKKSSLQKSGLQTKKAIPAEAIQIFLQNQAKELEISEKQIVIQAEQLTIQKQRDANSYAFSKQALETQADDRKNARDYNKKKRRDKYIFSSIVVFVISGLIVYSIYRDKDQFATEIVKAVIYLTAGGAGGYGVSKAQDKSQGQNKD